MQRGGSKTTVLVGMRWAAFAFSPFVRLGDTYLPRSLAHAGRALTMGSSLRSEVDVERARKDILGGATPATHFNAAGDSPMPRPVLERVTRHMEAEASLGGYEAAALCDEELESVYESAARLINAEPDEIALQVRIST